MMSSRVTLVEEEEGANVDGAVGAGGATDPNRHEQNCASLRLMVPASIAPMIGKGSKEGK